MFMFADHLTLVQAPWLVPDDTRPPLHTPEPGELTLRNGVVECLWLKGKDDAKLRRFWRLRITEN